MKNPIEAKEPSNLYSSVHCDFRESYATTAGKPRFLNWYLKIAIGSAIIGGGMKFFMIKTGFYDKVTVLKAEKRAWENSPEARAMREALNPWRNKDAEASKGP